jgi:uncharacterized membrane protein
MNNPSRLLACLTLLGALVAVALYPWLPERLPIHWGIDGRPDGWGHKSWAAFIGPLGMSTLQLGGRFLPAQRIFPEVLLAVGLLFLHFHAMTLLGGLYPALDLARPLIAGLLLCFAVLGNILGKVRPNPWVGVRTPWTMADEGNWIRTHRRAARLMVAAGLGGAALTLLGLPPSWAFVLLMVASLEPVFYSYCLAQKEKKR